MTYGLEVAQCSRAEIEHAIRSGVSCMRSLWWHNGGTLRGDLHQRALEWQPATDASAPFALREAPTWEGIGSRSVPSYAETPA